MTTIAWDGKTLAGDRMATVGDVPFRDGKKISRIIGGVHNGALVGASGTTADCYRFPLWLKGEVVDFRCDKGFSGVMIASNGKIYYTDEDMKTSDIRLPYFAIGAGWKIAMGAMAAGADAKKAILIASKLDAFTGMGVDIIEL